MRKHPILWVAILSVGLLASCGGTTSSVISSASAVSSSSLSSSVASSTMSNSSSSLEPSSSSPAPVLSKKTADFYFGSSAAKASIDLYFADGVGDLPYLQINDELLLYFTTLLGFGQSTVTISKADSKLTLTTPKEASMVIDFVKKTVSYSDFDTFYCRATSTSPLDLLAHTGFDDSGNPAYFERESNGFFFKGEEEAKVFDLGAYNIPMIYENDEGYLPLATFSDLFFGPNGTGIVYNGFAVFFNISIAAYGDTYYPDSLATDKVSETLARFNYDELCFNFDSFYGLFKKRGLDNFDSYFERLGYKEDMLSTNTLTAETAEAKAMFHGFSEAHSGFLMASAYTGEKFNPFNDDYLGPSLADRFALSKEYKAARTKGLGDDFLPYQEVDKTAFITFDEFAGNGVKDYYKNPVTTVTQESDTMALVEYAHKKITADGIENVVVDLSNNGGGEIDACMYITAWMVGQAEINIVDAVTGSTSTSIYKADVNMDNKFDDTDTIKDKNLYCLISPTSFSCGNLMPFMLKASGNVTLVGQKTGGGACVVAKLANAIGATGQFSGHNVLSTLKNGIYKDVDDGVDPDVVLTNKATYYNRTALASYLATLK